MKKLHPVEAEFLHWDRQTNKHDEAYIHFSHLWKRA
jgi:hypothetical protein